MAAAVRSIGVAPSTHFCAAVSHGEPGEDRKRSSPGTAIAIAPVSTDMGLCGLILVGS
jgi:hypothetical protein